MDISREYWSRRHIKILDDYVTQELRPESMETIFRIPFVSAHEFVLLSVDRYIYFGHRAVWWGEDVIHWRNSINTYCAAVRWIMCCFLQYRIWVNFNESQAPALWENWEKIQVSRRCFATYRFCTLPQSHAEIFLEQQIIDILCSLCGWLYKTTQNGRKNARLWNSMICESFFNFMKQLIDILHRKREKAPAEYDRMHDFFSQSKQRDLPFNVKKKLKLKLMLVSCTKNVFENCESCLEALYVCSSHGEVHHATRGLVNYIDMPCTECQKRSTIDVTHDDSPTSEFQHYVLKKFLEFPSSFFAAYLLAFYVWHSKFFRARMHHVDRPRGRQKIFINSANFSHFKTVSQFPSWQNVSLFCDLFRLLVLSLVCWHSRTLWQER